MEQIQVFLADDHELVRTGLRLLINAEPDLRVAGEAADGVEALEQMKITLPDVAVIDLSMPRMNGMELVNQLQRLTPTPRILALTANEDPAYIKLLFQLGATGYLLKRAAAEELIQAIRTVATGARFLNPDLVNLLVDQLVAPANDNLATAAATLTDRERDVLKMIAAGLTSKEIAAQLDISIKSIETYKSRGMQKLNLRGRAEIVRHAMMLGWLKSP